MPTASKPLLPPAVRADAEMFGYTRQDLFRINKLKASRAPGQLHSVLGQLIATLRPGGKVLRVLDIGSGTSTSRATFLRRNYAAYIDIFDSTEVGWNFDPNRHVLTKALIDNNMTYDFVLCHGVVEGQATAPQLNKFCSILAQLTSGWGFCLVSYCTTTERMQKANAPLAKTTVYTSLSRAFPNIWAAQKVMGRGVRRGDWSSEVGLNELWICNKMEI